jgi:anti-sigma regulatory factor (Ser/Thr protein kinase)
MTEAHLSETALPAELPSVTKGRHFVREMLQDWNLSALQTDAELGVSELVANAVLHGGTPISVEIRVDRHLTISVFDGNPRLHRPLAPAGREVEGGRGLRIIAAIAHDWGVDAVPGGKAIWFSLERPAAGGDGDIVSIGSRRARASVTPAITDNDGVRAQVA